MFKDCVQKDRWKKYILWFYLYMKKQSNVDAKIANETLRVYS